MANVIDFYNRNERNKIFGRKLCDLRERRNLSILRMSKETGFSRTSIANWEAGKVYPKSKEVFDMLAAYFHVPVSYFFQETCSYSDLVRRVELLEAKLKSGSL